MRTTIVKENTLSNWLEHTKSLNLDFTALRKYIANSDTCHYHNVYRLLDGVHSEDKARALFNRWRKEPIDSDNYPEKKTEEVKSEIIKQKINDKIECLIPSGTKIYYRSRPEDKFISHIYPEEPQYVYIEDSNFKIVSFDKRLRWRARSIKDFNKFLKDRDIIIDNLSQEEQDKLLGVWDNVILTSNVKFLDSKCEIGGYKFEFNNSSRNYFIVTPGATGNCQISVVAYANYIFQNSSNIKKQFAELYNCGRRMLLIDLNQKYVNELIKYLGKYIISRTPYNSTNGSEMEIFLVNVEKLYNELKNEQK